MQTPCLNIKLDFYAGDCWRRSIDVVFVSSTLCLEKLGMLFCWLQIILMTKVKSHFYDKTAVSLFLFTYQVLFAQSAPDWQPSVIINPSMAKNNKTQHVLPSCGVWCGFHASKWSEHLLGGVIWSDCTWSVQWDESPSHIHSGVLTNRSGTAPLGDRRHAKQDCRVCCVLCINTFSGSPCALLRGTR